MLRQLAGRASYVMTTFSDSQADPAAAHQAVQREFAFSATTDPNAWMAVNHYDYPAYVLFSFAGAMIAYDILATAFDGGLRGPQIGQLLREQCYAAGEARSWRSKPANLVGSPRLTATGAMTILSEAAS